MYYSLIGTFITLIVGIIVSYATASKDDAYESKLLHPVIYRFSQWLPGKDRFFSDCPKMCDSNDKLKNRTLEHQDNFAFELNNEKIVKNGEINEINVSSIIPMKNRNDINSNSCEENNLETSNTESMRPVELVEKNASELYRKLSEDTIVTR
jgi:hypothetical protein